MATEKSLIDQIKSLSELEFAALFEEIKEHAAKQKWDHIIEGTYGFGDRDDDI